MGRFASLLLVVAVSFAFSGLADAQIDAQIESAAKARSGYALANGDFDGDGKRNLSDALQFLIYLFAHHSQPVPLAYCGGVEAAVKNGDLNGDHFINVADAIHLLRWLYALGPEPVSACGGGGGARDLNPRVIPPHAKAYGKTYGDWGAAWWQWAFKTPLAENPVADPNGEFCDVGQSGNVWFLAGTFGGDATRSCTVPAGKSVFFPLLNSVVFCPLPDETVDDLRDQVNELIDVPLSEGTTQMHATVDGVEIQNLFEFRGESQSFTIPGGGLIEESIPECVGTDAVADGFWLFLPPLSAGSHVIHFSASHGAFEHSLFGPIDAFSLEVTYNIEVIGQGAAD